MSSDNSIECEREREHVQVEWAENARIPRTFFIYFFIYFLHSPEGLNSGLCGGLTERGNVGGVKSSEFAGARRRCSFFTAALQGMGSVVMAEVRREADQDSYTHKEGRHLQPPERSGETRTNALLPTVCCLLLLFDALLTAFVIARVPCTAFSLSFPFVLNSLPERFANWVSCL
jgi:hypothetical protein